MELLIYLGYWIILSFMYTVFVVIISLNKLEFIESYENIKEWQIKHILNLPLTLPCLILFLVVYKLTDRLLSMGRKFSPFLNRKIFK